MADWDIQSMKTHQYTTFHYFYCLFLFFALLFIFSKPYLFQPRICYSSCVFAMSEGVLGGLPTLEHPCVRLPWWGPSRASVRRTRWFTPANRSDRSDRPAQEALHRAPPRAARSSAFVCWPWICANSIIVIFGIKICQHWPKYLTNKINEQKKGNEVIAGLKTLTCQWVSSYHCTAE